MRRLFIIGILIAALALTTGVPDAEAGPRPKLKKATVPGFVLASICGRDASRAPRREGRHAPWPARRSCKRPHREGPPQGNARAFPLPPGLLGRDEDVLDLGVALEAVEAELPAEA